MSAQRIVNYRGGEQLVQPISLDRIYVSHNVRRPCRILQRQGIVPLQFLRTALSDKIEDVQEYAVKMQQEPGIVSLAISLQARGQIQPAVLRSFRSAIGKGEEGKTYEERYGYVAGERRGMATGLLEAWRKIALATERDPSCTTLTVGEATYELSEAFWKHLTRPWCLDAICLKITTDEAEKLAVEENDEREEMTELDWGLLFDKKLRSYNPATQQLWTIAEVARYHRKDYHYVRTRAALPYLPADWQVKVEDKTVNIVPASTYALKCKAKALESVQQQAEGTQGKVEAPVIPDQGQEQAQVSSQAQVGPSISKDEPTIEEAVKTGHRNNPLSRKEIEALFDATPEANVERRKALAEVLRLDIKAAAEQSIKRKEAAEHKKARQAERQTKKGAA
jgi:hypothetical protein